MRDVICPGLTSWVMAASEPDFESGSLKEKFKTEGEKIWINK